MTLEDYLSLENKDSAVALSIETMFNTANQEERTAAIAFITECAEGNFSEWVDSVKKLNLTPNQIELLVTNLREKDCNMAACELCKAYYGTLTDKCSELYVSLLIETHLDDDALLEYANNGNEAAREYFEEEGLLEDLCRRGIQWAFDLEEQTQFDGIDEWDFADFLLECHNNGIEKAKELFESVFLETWKNIIPDDLINILVNSAANGDKYAHELLCEKMGILESYSWLPDHLDEDYAKAVAQNLNKVFKQKKDIKWIENLADKKSPLAYYILGVLYLGDCPSIKTRNKDLANKYLTAALNAGYKDLVQPIFDQIGNNRKKEEEKQNNKKETELEILLRKAEADSLSADEYLQLGLLLAYGANRKNASKATKYIRIAAGQGIAKAQYHLGKRLIEGQGCKKSWNAGMSWMRKAAAQNYREAYEFVKENDTFFARVFHKFVK